MTRTAPARAMLAASPRKGASFWARRIGYGFLFGAALTLLEFAHYVPLAPMPTGPGLLSLVTLLMVYGGECIVLALTVAFVEYCASPRELRVSELVLAIV